METIQRDENGVAWGDLWLIRREGKGVIHAYAPVAQMIAARMGQMPPREMSIAVPRATIESMQLEQPLRVADYWALELQVAREGKA